MQPSDQDFSELFEGPALEALFGNADTILEAPASPDIGMCDFDPSHQSVRSMEEELVIDAKRSNKRRQSWIEDNCNILATSPSESNTTYSNKRYKPWVEDSSDIPVVPPSESDNKNDNKELLFLPYRARSDDPSQQSNDESDEQASDDQESGVASESNTNSESTQPLPFQTTRIFSGSSQQTNEESAEIISNDQEPGEASVFTIRTFSVIHEADLTFPDLLAFFLDDKAATNGRDIEPTGQYFSAAISPGIAEETVDYKWGSMSEILAERDNETEHQYVTRAFGDLSKAYVNGEIEDRGLTYMGRLSELD